MKLGARDIEPFLKNPGKACGALIYGVDGGMVRQRVAQLSERFLGPKADPTATLELTADQIKEDPARLADELAAFSLMADQRVVLIRDAEDAVLPALEEALARRALSNFVILYATDALGGSKLRAYIERSDELASLPCYKDEGSGLEAVIRDTLRGYGLRANTEVTRFLAAQLNGDRQIILNELEKLSLYLGDETEEVTLEDAQAAIGENNDKSLDDLAHAVAAGDMATLCKLSDRLLAEGQVGLLLVRGVMRYLVRLRELAVARERGQSLDMAIEALRPPVFFKMKPILKAHAPRWSVASVNEALARLQILELDSKRYHDQSETRMAHGLMQVAQLAQVRRG
jgi:DNA polymerase-3 subunit delta